MADRYEGECIGGPFNGQIIACRIPFLRAVVRRRLSAMAFKRIEPVPRYEPIETIDYLWDRGRWRIPGLQT